MHRRATLILVAFLLALAVGVYATQQPPAPAPSGEARQHIWAVDMMALNSISVRLPRTGNSGSWVKRGDERWYFNTADASPVDEKRWGGGIPLLLSSPGAERLIVRDPTAQQLTAYGLSQPRMLISLGLEDGKKIDAEVGDANPDGETYYIRLVGADAVHAIDHTWYAVIERLVLSPPYPENRSGEKT